MQVIYGDTIILDDNEKVGSRGVNTPDAVIPPAELKGHPMKKVLAVDNNRLILEFMTDLLTQEGHEVVTAVDGILALDVLNTYTPDIIFIDLIMPNIDGRKLCQIIRGTPELKDAFVVILSAVAPEDEIDLARLGADVYIAKGKLKDMAKHILTAIEQSEQKTPERREERIKGLDSTFPREATRELLSIRKHFEVILESLGEGILEITPDKRIIYANSSALSLLDLSEEKLLGMKLVELVGPPDREKTEKLLQTMSVPPEAASEETAFQLNGKEVLIRIIPLADEEQKTIVILKDISEQKRMEAQFLLAQKMEAIGTLAGGIAHDFNNLLTGVLGSVSLLLWGIDETHPHYEKLKRIENLVRSGSSLTSQLLGYARKGRYEIKVFNLNQLVEEASETFSRTRKEVTIHRELAPDLLVLRADQGQIEQVLFNLFINAADAMLGGGNLILKTANITHKEMKEKLYGLKPGNYVLLTVTDTGTGMDEETLQHIFEPFFTTKETGKGTGLGLASVYGIIKGHGGYIDVESQKGEGTTFRIYLPATEGREKTASKTSDQALQGTETILLVDDEEMIHKATKEMLELMGYRILTAGDGKEAIECYIKNQEAIDLVILDMVMPAMGGGETYDCLKEVNPNIKVLLSSGYSIDGEATAVMERGCQGFIQKPFDMKQLSRKIREVLDKK